MTETRAVMVLEENAAMRNFLFACVHAGGYDADVTDNARDAIRRSRTRRPDAVILSLAAPRSIRALRTISVLHAIDPTVPIIVVAGQPRGTLIAQALSNGATDFVTAPFDESDVSAALARVLKRHLGGRPASDKDSDEAPRRRLVGSSRAITVVRRFIERAAATDVTVLIRGDSGTGKMLVAREIVAASQRWNQPFVKVNCAARSDALLGAEAFAPTSFSRGVPDLEAKFACANHGTLFLDEIGEMSASMQNKLLKILQDRESAHLQGTRGTGADVRVIASTAGDLERAVSEGRFREELFFRLNVLSVQLPALRERREDIPALAEYFLQSYAAQYDAIYDHVSAPTMRQLIAHDWPGNVRELDNVIRRIVLLGSDVAITADLGGRVVGTTDSRAREVVAPSPVSDTLAMRSLKEHARLAAREAERTLILRTLEQTHWNRKEAATLLGISYKALLKKIKDCDLQNT